MKCLSVRQPWAWAIIHGGKDIENRSRPTRHRGPLAIHSSKGLAKLDYAFDAKFIQLTTGVIVPAYEDLIFGAILGTVNLVDCVKLSSSPWFQGRYGFVLQDAEPWRIPIITRGALGFWHFDEAKELGR